MTKMLVLVRHGKAQVRNDERPDFDRTLTRAGKRSLAAWFPRVARLLDEEKPGRVELWTSPADRARQTADILAEVLAKHTDVGLLEPVEVTSLWEQSIDQLHSEIRDSGADAIILVGHNPILEDAIEAICGDNVSLSTGGAAALRLGDTWGMGADTRLLWLMQGPESKRWKRLVEIEDVIAAAADAVVSRHEAFLGNPEDAEVAHKFRVSIRTVRGLLSFVRPFMKNDQYARLQDDFRELVACTSRLREYDVLIGEVEGLEPVSEALLEACKDARAKECKRTMATLSSKSARKRLAGAVREAHKISWRRSFEREGLDADAVPNRFAKLSSDLRADLDALDLADAERTHDVRKRAKQLRYAAERFGDLIGNDASAVAESMKGEQDRLGSLCDARVNIEIIDEFSTKGLPEEALWALSLLRARNESYLYTTLRGQQ